MKNSVAPVLFFLWWAAMLGLACHPEILNPDPAHGGACGNGDQLATACPNKVDCCPDGYACAADGHGCEIIDPSPDPNGGFVHAKRDAGR